jgi:hypothetical protein
MRNMKSYYPSRQRDSLTLWAPAHEQRGRTDDLDLDFLEIRTEARPQTLCRVLVVAHHPGVVQRPEQRPPEYVVAHARTEHRRAVERAVRARRERREHRSGDVRRFRRERARDGVEDAEERDRVVRAAERGRKRCEHGVGVLRDRRTTVAGRLCTRCGGVQTARVRVEKREVLEFVEERKRGALRGHEAAAGSDVEVRGRVLEVTLVEG